MTLYRGARQNRVSLTICARKTEPGAWVWLLDDWNLGQRELTPECGDRVLSCCVYMATMGVNSGLGLRAVARWLEACLALTNWVHHDAVVVQSSWANIRACSLLCMLRGFVTDK